MKAWILTLMIAAAPAAAWSVPGGFTFEWAAELSNDGSTNYLPIALTPNDEAVTLTLTDYHQNDTPFTGFLAQRRHGLDGVRQAAHTYYASPGLNIVSRRDIVREPQSGEYWIAANVESNPRQSRFLVADVDGNVSSEWTDPALGKEVVDLSPAGGGAVYSVAAMMDGSGVMVVDRYGAPGTVQWSASVATGLGNVHDAGIVAAPDGGAYAAIANCSAGVMSISRFTAVGDLQWTVTAPASSLYNSLGIDVDAAGNAVLLCRSGSYLALLTVAPDGSMTVAPSQTYMTAYMSLEVLSSGKVLVGGAANQDPALALLDPVSGAELNVFRPHNIYNMANFVTDSEETGDGRVYVTFQLTNSATSPVQHTYLALLDIGGDGGQLPGYLPTPTSTLTPTGVPQFTATPTASPAGTTPAYTATPTASPAVTAVENSPTATPTRTPTTVIHTFTPTQAPTQEPTAVPTSVPTQEATAVPTTAPTQEPTAVPTQAPTQIPTHEPSPVQGGCAPTVEKVQLVPCPVLDVHGGRIKIRLGACPPERLRITVFSQALVAVLDWSVDATGMGPGWNDVALPAGVLGPGTYQFRVTAERGGSSSTAVDTCMILR